MYWISKEIKNEWIGNWDKKFNVPARTFWKQCPVSITGLPIDILTLFQKATLVLKGIRHRHLLPALAERIPHATPEVVDLGHLRNGEEHYNLYAIYRLLRESIKYYPTIDLQLIRWLDILDCHLGGEYPVKNKPHKKFYVLTDALLNKTIAEIQQKTYVLESHPDVVERVRKLRKFNRGNKVNIEKAVVENLKHIYMFIKDKKLRRITSVRIGGMEALLVAIKKDARYDVARDRILRIISVFIDEQLPEWEKERRKR